MRRERELTHELVEQMAYLRRIGTPIPEMCRRLGFGVSVFYRWVNEAKAFAVLDQMKEAGLTFEEIVAVVGYLERERESRR